MFLVVMSFWSYFEERRKRRCGGGGGGGENKLARIQERGNVYQSQTKIL